MLTTCNTEYGYMTSYPHPKPSSPLLSSPRLASPLLSSTLLSSQELLSCPLLGGCNFLFAWLAPGGTWLGAYVLLGFDGRACKILQICNSTLKYTTRESLQHNVLCLCQRLFVYVIRTCPLVSTADRERPVRARGRRRSGRRYRGAPRCPATARSGIATRVRVLVRSCRTSRASAQRDAQVFE